MLIQSPLLTHFGFKHGFSTREGGVSKPPFDTLNMAYASDDARNAVHENRRRFADALGIDIERLFELSQVHGHAVRAVREGDEAGIVRNEEGDALLALHGTGQTFALGIRTADCVPILMAHKNGLSIAAIHAGWRGVVQRVIDDAATQLFATTKRPANDFIVAIGPHIQRCCFEVGEDVAHDIETATGVKPVISNGKFKADLTQAVGRQLNAVGIDDNHIEVVGGCTYCQPELFFSYRRDGQRSGRMLSCIAT